MKMYSVLATLLYGSRAWAPTRQQQGDLRVCSTCITCMWCLRRLLGVSLRECFRVQEILKHCNAQSMDAMLRKGRMHWLGHSFGMPVERLPKQLLWAQRPGTRPWGKPPTRWREDTASQDVRSMGVPCDWRWVAPRRAAWHQAAKGVNVNPRALTR